MSEGAMSEIPLSETHGRNDEQVMITKSSSATADVTRATLAKDLRLEWRSKDAINSMLFFALLVVVVFSFSFDPNAEESRQIAGGLVWVAFLFAAVVALNQTWARELRNQVLDAYRVSPAPANSLFLAKALGNFVFVALLEMLMTPLFIMFYKLRPLGPAWQLIPVAVLGTWAIVVNGTFFCRHVATHSQPRDHAPVAAVSNLHPRPARHGERDHSDFDRRALGPVLDCVAYHLRRGVYYRLSALIRIGITRRMKPRCVEQK
jgi:heme exporter protein CcmB